MVDEAVVCPHCGCAVPNSRAASDGISNNSAEDAPSSGFMALGILFPLVGFILYLACKDKTPLKASSAGKGAAIGILISVICGVIGGFILGNTLFDVLYDLL